MMPVISGRLLESDVVAIPACRFDQHYGNTQAIVVAFPSANIRPSIGYLRLEFPSEFWSLPNVETTVTYSLAEFFVSLLPKDSRIENVYWFSEDDVLKVWTVIPEPDFSLEKPIYEAQMVFIEKTEYECDFSVIYRFGKNLNDIKPQGSRQVL
ncbi:MAG: hypothetical protein ACREKS_03805 [Candidatus Rokuibacteriota bacterium]